MLKLFLAFFFFLVFLGGLAFFLAWFFKKKGIMQGSGENTTSANTIQEFLPLEEIEDNFLRMKDGSKVLVIEVDSVSYLLMTETEQEAVEMMFSNFLHSLSYPIKFFIQTRIIDNTKRMEHLILENDEVISKFPNLEEYSNMYIEAMSGINDYLGQSKEKKKFIVIPYEVDSSEDFSQMEKEEQIERELYSRAESIRAGLAPIGLNCKILDKAELITLVYTCFNREGFSYTDNINELEALSLFVTKKERPDTEYLNILEKNAKANLKSVINSYKKHPEIFDDLSNEDISKLNEIFEKLGGKENIRDYDF